MATPKGWHDWVGVFIALCVLSVGVIVLADIRDGEGIAPALANVAIGICIAALATAAWCAWAYLRRFDRPGHEADTDSQNP